MPSMESMLLTVKCGVSEEPYLLSDSSRQLHPPMAPECNYTAAKMMHRVSPACAGCYCVSRLRVWRRQGYTLCRS